MRVRVHSIRHPKLPGVTVIYQGGYMKCPAERKVRLTHRGLYPHPKDKRRYLIPSYCNACSTLIEAPKSFLIPSPPRGVVERWLRPLQALSRLHEREPNGEGDGDD